jgi:hypothetical protein
VVASAAQVLALMSATPESQFLATIADRIADLAYIYGLSIEAHLRKPFGQMKPSQLTTEKLRDYRKRRLAEGDKNSTINRELSYLARRCAWL